MNATVLHTCETSLNMHCIINSIVGSIRLISNLLLSLLADDKIRDNKFLISLTHLTRNPAFKINHTAMLVSYFYIHLVKNRKFAWLPTPHLSSLFSLPNPISIWTLPNNITKLDLVHQITEYDSVTISTPAACVLFTCIIWGYLPETMYHIQTTISRCQRIS